MPASISPSVPARARSIIYILQCFKMKRPRCALGSSASCLWRTSVNASVTSPCLHCKQHQGHIPGMHSLSTSDGTCIHRAAYCQRSCSNEPSAPAGEVESDGGSGAPSLPEEAMRRARDGKAPVNSRRQLAYQKLQRRWCRGPPGGAHAMQ